MTSKYARRPETTPRFSRLETEVMAALAYELRQTIPDLARQFAAASPGRRRNTAFGAYTGMTGDRPRSGSEVGLTGRFGTVHAMILGLPGSVLFQVELLNGGLFALHADSYGQDTRAVDFAHAHPTEIFTIDAAGRSIPFEAAPKREGPQRAQPRDPAPPPAASPEPRLVNVGALQRVQETERPVNAYSAAARSLGGTPLPPPAEIPVAEDRKSLLLGLWVAIGAAALLAVLVFGVPFPIAIFAAIFVGRAVKTPKVLDVVAALLTKAQEQQALNRRKP